ncbi:hypothetical protein ACEQ8H_007774 [Pleosporales sp. CAS-2024a]
MGIKRSRQASVSSSESSTPCSREQSAEVKMVHLDAEAAMADLPAVMRCSLPPHEPLSFASFDAYDVHHQKMHMNRCCECHRNFPDEHFLHLHIAENHDPINASKRDKGEKTVGSFMNFFPAAPIPVLFGELSDDTAVVAEWYKYGYVAGSPTGLVADVLQYACLVPDCDRFCSTPQKRRLHCIDKHQFPRNYDFFIVNDGIDSRASMLRSPHRRRSSAFSGTGEGSTRRRGESCASMAGEGMDVVQDEEDEGEARRIPVKLRGRGGFSHARGQGASSAATGVDAVDSLASSMAALQFVPHSVRMARGRGRGSRDSS